MTTFLTIIHVMVCLFLVGIVLLQSGRAGGMGVLSGAATQTVFGGRGAGGFLAKATTFCAGMFMVTSAALAYTSTSGRDSLARQGNAAVVSPAAAPRRDGGVAAAPAASADAGAPAAPAVAADAGAAAEPAAAAPAAAGDAAAP
ncbi:MAG: preprotein translocase subunit SecG [Polyangiales bacterium]